VDSENLRWPIRRCFSPGSNVGRIALQTTCRPSQRRRLFQPTEPISRSTLGNRSLLTNFDPNNEHHNRCRIRRATLFPLPFLSRTIYGPFCPSRLSIRLRALCFPTSNPIPDDNDLTMRTSRKEQSIFFTVAATGMAVRALIPATGAISGFLHPLCPRWLGLFGESQNAESFERRLKSCEQQ
jgi:hypothetical protein